jgi:hypothetical protein
MTTTQTDKEVQKLSELFEKEDDTTLQILPNGEVIKKGSLVDFEQNPLTFRESKLGEDY